MNKFVEKQADTRKNIHLGIIIVNYHTEEKTISYITNELSKITTPHVIVVVNNEATERSNSILSQSLAAEVITDIDYVKNLSNSCYIISHSDNLGYAKGNNLGVQFTIRHYDVSYFLFSNNDIVFISDNVVETLLQKIDAMPDVAIIGPKIIGMEGDCQSPYPYYSFWNRYVWMHWLTPFMSNRMKIKIFKLNYTNTASEGAHYRIMGSFFIARQEDFVECGMMDPNTFLFSEEVILSERLHRIDKKVFFYPVVTVLHEHNQTISKFYNKKKQCKMGFESEAYYYNKYRKVSLLSIFIGKCSYWCYLEIMDKYMNILKLKTKHE